MYLRANLYFQVFGGNGEALAFLMVTVDANGADRPGKSVPGGISRRIGFQFILRPDEIQPGPARPRQIGLAFGNGQTSLVGAADRIGRTGKQRSLRIKQQVPGPGLQAQTHCQSRAWQQQPHDGLRTIRPDSPGSTPRRTRTMP